MIRKFAIIVGLQVYLIVLFVGGIAFAGWLFLQKY